MTSWFNDSRRTANQAPISLSSISQARSSSFLWLGKNADSLLSACVVSSSCSKFVLKALLPRPWSGKDGCSCLKAHAIHVPGNRTGDRSLRGRPVLNRHWLCRAAEEKHCHCPSVLAHPWFSVAIQEGTERSNSAVDRIYTSIDQHGTGNKHQTKKLE